MRISSIFLGLLLALLVGVNVTAAEYNPARRHGAAPVITGVERVIVKFRTADASGRTQIQSASDTVAALTARTQLTLKQTRRITAGLHVMQFEPQTAGESLAASLARLRADPAVEYAEVDQRRYAHATPNDPLYSGQWYLQNASTTPSAVDAISAWDTTTGSASIVIADIDSGVRFDHPDLLRLSAGGRLLPGYDFVSDVNVANDGDGRDADPSDPGDWVTSADTQTATFSGCTVSNSSWHGTRVSGILGALTNNSVGIAGLTWSGAILPVRALGKCGGSDSDIEAAMLWAAGIHVDGVPDNPNPATIVNMSLGGSGSCPQSYQDVINQLIAKGVMLVASAGNEGGPVDAPANCTGVAAVAGLRHAGTKVGYSSLGKEIALSAPAGNCVNITGNCLYSINTTYNTGTTTPATNSYTDQTNYNVGTSFSAPIVSAIAALMLSVNGNLDPSHLIARLKEGATTPFPVSSDSTVPQCHVPTSSTDLQTSECSCTTQTCGAGMANAVGALNAALRPIAVIVLPATITAGQNVSLSGTTSTAANGHTITGYAWSILNGNSNSPSISGANTSTATVPAPSSGSYTVQLTVTDDAGKQDTASATVTPTTVAAVAVSVSPTSASVQAGIGTQAFTATVTNTTNTAVTWQVGGVTGGNATVGTITTSGVYRAPVSVPSPATLTVTAVSAADTSRSGSAQVTVTAPVAISVSPASASVQAGTGTQAFTAAVTNASTTVVTWQINGVTGGNATVGTISTSGIYTAPASVPSPATVTVTAVSAADTSRAATAQVTITAATAATTSSAGSGSGGGAMDLLTLLALALTFACSRSRAGASIPTAASMEDNGR